MISFAFWRQPNGLWIKNCARSGPAVEKPGTYWPASVMRCARDSSESPFFSSHSFSLAGREKTRMPEPQAVPRLLTDDAGAVVKTVFENGGCGHP
jgi:hypothetical protein